MMTSANTEDPWIVSNRSKARELVGYTHQSVFEDGRFRFKIDPQPDSSTQPKARWLLHMECDFAIAHPYNLDFKTDELDHLSASWQFRYY
jgi:hypothetical protein